ncbi:nuclear transport factor 2 family protein [Hydrogenophaga sp. YM1]|uniref:nuclear transport factor 2 family protein n=1 Tax=Hydrogenophaga sp. YM1 TaxID=2806262 RepID=UPI001EF74789|nr:nuclear transport factor 2 family protein [Hydrogenophaga sp. YM1]
MKELIHRYLRAYQGFDLEGMLALLSPDVRFENHSGGQLTHATDGVQAFRALAEQSMLQFAEREQRIVRLRFQQDAAVADVAYRARLAVDLPGGPSAGAVLALRGRSEFSFKAGRISRLVDRS